MRLGHEQPDHLLGRIDPIVGLGRARPAELADRARRRGQRRIHRDPRAEAEAVAGQRKAGDLQRQQRRRHAVGVHELQRLAPDDPRAVEFAAVRQHLGEAEIVGGRAEQAVAAAHEGVRPVDRIGGARRRAAGCRRPSRPGTLRGVCPRDHDVRAAVHGGEPRPRFAAGTPKPVSTMPSGSNRRSPRTVAERLAGDDLDEARRDVDAEAVVPARAGLEGERKLPRGRRSPPSAGPWRRKASPSRSMPPTGKSSRKW